MISSALKLFVRSQKGLDGVAAWREDRRGEKRFHMLPALDAALLPKDFFVDVGRLLCLHDKEKIYGSEFNRKSHLTFRIASRLFFAKKTQLTKLFMKPAPLPLSLNSIVVAAPVAFVTTSPH